MIETEFGFSTAGEVAEGIGGKATSPSTTGLHNALKAAGNARVVSVTSRVHMLSPVISDDVHYAFRRYEPWGADGQSKTANVLFSVEATRRWMADGITANAVMPGAIHINLQRGPPRRDAAEARSRPVRPRPGQRRPPCGRTPKPSSRRPDP
ncbi:hypothetical protein [Lentzea sp.]|uniref:hypothetical protein n=1 Tax=Lentzea sp. TaxID=56099 RepID=UPI002B5DA505|nr:hypothetical protein [Lentzea sp.]HUQ57256.1 hypothetical protein [Lentzea sp.]